MARAEEVLIEEIMNILLEEPQGLEVNIIIERLSSEKGFISPRGIRNLLKQLEQEKKLIKRKRWGKGPGSPPFVYFHPNHVPQQLDFWGNLVSELGASIQRYDTKPDVERENIEYSQGEKERQAESRSVLKKIAEEHLDSDQTAKTIVLCAEEIANNDPVLMVTDMAEWMIDNIQKMVADMKLLNPSNDRVRFAAMRDELDFRIGRVKEYFYNLWRLYPTVDREYDKGILNLPDQAIQLLSTDKMEDYIGFDRSLAIQELRNRIIGDKVVDTLELTLGVHKSAAGTDASVADLYLEHTQGSFVPPDPVIVTAAAAALKTYDNLNTGYEYQDFDIYPDQLNAYTDLTAAIEGLIISPTLRANTGDIDIKHTRMAAMDLRQYTEDFRVATRDAKWRPFGGSPMDTGAKPRLIIRDGRIFPLVHRISDFESNNNVYGRIVRSEIEKFGRVFHHTTMGMDDTVYAAAVKNPEMSWLAPLVFWYLHKEGKKTLKGELVVTEDKVYRPLFADTAVSHLLFLGLAQFMENLSQNKFFVTFRAVRRFSDIVVPSGAFIVEEDLTDVVFRKRKRLVNGNNLDDWKKYVDQRVTRKKEESYESCLSLEEYTPLLHLCTKAGTSMCYAAPTVAYRHLLKDSEGGHFLLPRLEVAINVQDLKQAERNIQEFLSWLAGNEMQLDDGHTQTAFDTGDRERQLPVLVPDVIYRAHETVTFARDVLGQEVQDEIRRLIVELRRRAEKAH